MASSLSGAVRPRLLTLGGLAAVSISSPTDCTAFIVDSGTINLQVPANIDGIYLNFLTLQTGSTGSAVPGWDFNPFLSNGVITFFWPQAATAGGVESPAPGIYASLGFGDTVGPSSTFTLGSISSPVATVNFQIDGIRVLGFRFFNEATSMVNYGYLELQSGSSTGFPASIIRVVYENNGGAIGMPIPEPSVTALWTALAAGAVGLRAWRRQRAA